MSAIRSWLDFVPRQRGHFDCEYAVNQFELVSAGLFMVLN